MPRQKYHWLRDTPDTRDYIYKPTANKLPALVDMRLTCSAIEDQGNLGSCTSNAIAGAIELVNRKNRKMLDVSRLFIYYEERVLEGSINSDAGAYIRDGLKVVNKKGAPLESMWLYVESQFAVQPSSAAYTDALKRKVTAYQRCADFNAVKAALAAGNPVVVGFDVYSSFESAYTANTGIMTYPNKRFEQLLGGHAVCLVGYKDSTQQFIARNSWGTGWGDHGYFYMPFRVIQDTTMSGDFWTIVSVTNP